MSNPATIAKILKCDEDTAEKIFATMYNWIQPHWGNDTEQSLRMDLKIAAQLEGIQIVKAKKCVS